MQANLRKLKEINNKLRRENEDQIKKKKKNQRLGMRASLVIEMNRVVWILILTDGIEDGLSWSADRRKIHGIVGGLSLLSW